MWFLVWIRRSGYRVWCFKAPLVFNLPNLGDGPWRTVVGVVGDVRQAGLDIETRPEMFWPYYQLPVSFATFVVRTSGDPEAMTSAVRSAMQEIDKDLPLYGIRTVDEVISESVAPAD